jgi:hypothetical protein
MSRTSCAAKDSGEAVLALLRFTNSVAAAFPPLQAAAGGALYIAQLIVVSLVCVCKFVVNDNLSFNVEIQVE